MLQVVTCTESDLFTFMGLGGETKGRLLKIHLRNQIGTRDQ